MADTSKHWFFYWGLALSTVALVKSSIFTISKDIDWLGCEEGILTFLYPAYLFRRWLIIWVTQSYFRKMMYFIVAGRSFLLLVFFLNIYCSCVLLSITEDVRELSWMSHGFMRFWFLLNFPFILAFFDILASLSIARVFSAALQADEILLFRYSQNNYQIWLYKLISTINKEL